jgi:hypothetical protein
VNRRATVSVVTCVVMIALASTFLRASPSAACYPCSGSGSGSSAVEDWFERVRCDIQRLTTQDRDLALIEVVLHEGRLVRLGHLEPESPSRSHNRVSGTLYAVAIEHEYWRSTSGAIDSLLTDFAIFSSIDRAGRPQVRGRGDHSDSGDQFVVPGDRVLGLIERVPFGPLWDGFIGRTELWKLRRALVIRPEGYSVATIANHKALIQRLADAGNASGLRSEGERAFSEPLDAGNVNALIEATVATLEATRKAGASVVDDVD